MTKRVRCLSACDANPVPPGPLHTGDQAALATVQWLGNCQEGRGGEARSGAGAGLWALTVSIGFVYCVCLLLRHSKSYASESHGKNSRGRFLAVAVMETQEARPAGRVW